MSAPASSSPPPPAARASGASEVSIVQVPQLRVVSLHRVIESYRAQSKLWQQLYAFAKGSGLYSKANGPSLVVYYDPGCKASDIDLEVCLPITADASDVPEHDEIQARELPAHARAASITFVGPYTELPSAYKALYKWVHDQQHEISGPVREVYHHEDYENDPEGKSFVTELQLPIA